MGTLDNDGTVRELILALHPDEKRPYARSEELAAAGLRFPKGHLVDEGALLSDIFDGLATQPMS